MDIVEIKKYIEESLEDVHSLERDVGRLEDEKIALMEQIRLLEEENYSEAIAIDTTPTNTTDIESTRATNENSGNNKKKNGDTPLLQHKYFDDSLLEFFGSNQSDAIDKNQNKDGDVDCENGERSRKRRRTIIPEGIHNLALYENIYRFGGITAFPINKYLFDENEEILGLRFDVFTFQKFHTPHYVILRKEPSKDHDKWRVFKHTLPVYVPIRQYEAQLDDNDVTIAAFAKSIRTFLVLIQYKHDKFNLVNKLGFKVIPDLQCERVIVEKALKRMELICSNDRIDEVHITLQLSKELKLYYESMLRNCPIKDLVKTFRKISKT